MDNLSAKNLSENAKYGMHMEEYIPTPQSDMPNYTLRRIICAVCAIVVLALCIMGICSVFGKSNHDPDNLFSDSMAVFSKVNKKDGSILQGVINKKGKIILDAKYTSVEFAGEKLLKIKKPVKTKGSDLIMTAITKRNGKEVTEFDYTNMLSFSEGLIAAQKDNKWGYMNKKGEWVIKPKYYYATEFGEGLAAVMTEKKDSYKFGYIDKKGNWIIKPKYDAAFPFEDDKATVYLDGKCGIIDKDGNWIIKNDFLAIGTFSEKMAPAMSQDNKWGYIDTNGKWIIKDKYQEAYEFCDGLARVLKGGTWGYINKNGKWKIDNDFSDAGDFSQGLAFAREEGEDKYGYINQKGEWIIEPKFASVSTFDKSMALASKDGKLGYINKKGKWVIEPAFKKATSFYKDGYAIVCTGDKDSDKNDKWFVINRKGKNILKDTFDGIGEYYSY